MVGTKEYELEMLLREYESLRAELLQVFDQQVRLVFTAAISTVVALIGGLLSTDVILPGLPIFIGVLVCIASKSISNYKCIYRIGSYLAIFHEQRGQSEKEFRPGLNRAAWHSRWRKVARTKYTNWSENSGPSAEALFLFVLATGGWVMVIGKLGPRLLSCTSNILLTLVAGTFSILLVYQLYSLSHVIEFSQDYENAFRRLLQEELAEK